MAFAQKGYSLPDNDTKKRIAGNIRFQQAILFIYVLASVFYIFPSGYPQPADFLMAVGIGIGGIIYLAHSSFRLPYIYFAAVAFGIYVFLINLVHWLFYHDLQLFLSSLYYIYNAALFILICSLFEADPRGTETGLYKAVYTAFGVMFILVLFFPGIEGIRATGPFNNPNQLAYWSLLTAAIIIILKFHEKLNLFDLSIVAASGYLQAVALSKAGMISFILLVAFLFFTRAVKTTHKLIGVFFVLIALLYGLNEFEAVHQKLSQIKTTDKVISRLENIGSGGDDSLAGRGYLRVIDNPIYLILGAGEGAYWRFDPLHPTRALHSGIITLVFAYGIGGTFLFCCFLWLIFKRDWRFMIILGILMLYGLTHQNIRFSYFWVFLATCYGVSHYSQTQRFADKPVQDNQCQIST
jgi:hypothetical protein